MATKTTRWPASYGLLADYCAMAGTTAIAVAAGATRHHGVALVLLAVAVAAIAFRATPASALATGAMGWLFYAGFITGRHADLAWRGGADIGPIAVLLGAALGGLALSWLLARPLAEAPRARGIPDPEVVLNNGGQQLIRAG